MSDFQTAKCFGKLRTCTKFSRALKFRESRGFANLRENKVLAKFKCFTVLCKIVEKLEFSTKCLDGLYITSVILDIFVNIKYSACCPKYIVVCWRVGVSVALAQRGRWMHLVSVSVTNLQG